MATLKKMANETPPPEFPRGTVGACTPEDRAAPVATRPAAVHDCGAAMNLQMLKHIPAGTEGHPRGRCESCGLCLWSEGGYRVPGLKGLFCSLACIECGIAEKAGQKKQIAGAPIGGGARLLLHLKTAAPRTYAQLAQGAEATGSKRCLECGTSLNGKRADAEFCDEAHRKRHDRRRKSKTEQKIEIIADMPIQNTVLSEAQNAG